MKQLKYLAWWFTPVIPVLGRQRQEDHVSQHLNQTQRISLMAELSHKPISKSIEKLFLSVASSVTRRDPQGHDALAVAQPVGHIQPVGQSHSWFVRLTLRQPFHTSVTPSHTLSCTHRALGLPLPRAFTALTPPCQGSRAHPVSKLPADTSRSALMTHRQAPSCPGTHNSQRA